MKVTLKKNRILLAIFTALLSIACFASAFYLKPNSVAMADVTKTTQSKITSIDKANGVTYNLFDGTEESVSIYNSIGQADWSQVHYEINDSSVIYLYAYNATSASPRQNNVFICVDLPQSIQTAIKNGVKLNFNFSVNLKTQGNVQSTIKGRDNSDWIFFDVIAGTRGESFSFEENKDKNFTDTKTFNASNNNSTNTDFNAYTITFTTEDLKDFEYSSFMLHCYSKVNTTSVGWAWTGNVLYVQNPTITVTSDDNTAPEVSISEPENKDVWSNSDKYVTINAEDVESGISKVLVNGTAVTPTYSDDTKTATYNYPVTQNGEHNLTVEVVDNVGNTATYDYTYTENRIDKTAPTVGIEMSDFFVKADEVKFIASFESEIAGQAAQYFRYTVDGSEPTAENGYDVLNGENAIANLSDGTYTLKIKAFDQAGNSVTQEKTFSIDGTSPEFSIVEPNNKDVWTNEDKILTVNVSDGGCGIGSVKVNGADATFVSGDDNSAVYSFVISQNGNYEVTAADKAGNVAESVTYVESKIDKTAPELAIEIGEAFSDKSDVDFVATKQDDNGSAPSYFYKITDGDLTVCEREIIFENGNAVTVSLTEFLSEYENGKHEFTIIFTTKDEAGNEQSFSRIFVLDDSEYSVSVSYANEWADSINCPELGSFKCGTKLTFTVKEGYVLFGVKVNDIEVEKKYFSENGYEFSVIAQDTEIQFYCKKIVTVGERFDKYSNGNSIVYTGENIDVNSVIDDEICAIVDFEQKDIKDSGEYAISWSINADNDDKYVGSGSFTVVVGKLVISDEDIRGLEYTYGEANFSLANWSWFNIFEQEVKVNVGDETSVSLEDLNEKLNALVSGEYALTIYVNGNVAEKTVNITVNKKDVEVTVTSGNLTFNGSSRDVSEAVSNVLFVGFDALDYNVTIKRNGTEVKADDVWFAGEYTYIVTIVSDKYQGEASGSFSVGKAAVTLSANEISAVYGDTIPTPTYSINGIEGELLTFFKKYEDNISLKVKDFGSKRPVVNTYASYIVFDEISGGVLDNFTVTCEAADVIITKKDVNVYVNSAFMYYGEEDPELTYTPYGLLEGDSLLGSLKREEGIVVGTYSIFAELSSDNYNIIVLNDGTLTILKRQIIVKTYAEGTKVYGAEDDPNFKAEVLVGIEYIPENYEFVFEREEGNVVGLYEIYINDILVGGESILDNFDLVVVSGEMEIIKRKLIITPDSLSKIYGEEDPELTYIVEGLLDGDVVSGSLSRADGENVGAYAIKIGTLYADNYEIVLKPVKFTINKRELKITANGFSKIYGEEDPELTYIAEGLLAGDRLYGNIARIAGENVGLYDIVIGTLYAENYQIEFIVAKLEIQKKNVVVTLNDESKVYGEDDPDFGFSIDGAYEDEIGLEIFRESGENVGEYKIYATYNADNYEVVITDGVLTIEKADYDNIYIGKESTTYNGSAQYMLSSEKYSEFTYTYYDSYGNKTEPINAGTYKVIVTFNGDENHKQGATFETTFTVKQKTVSVIVDANEMEYTGYSILPKVTVLEDVPYLIEFEKEGGAIEKGEYKYKIYTTDSNYSLNVSGVLTIK